MKYNARSIEGIEVFTPEGREMLPQISAANHSFTGMTRPISGVRDTCCRGDYEAIISDGDNALAQGIFEQVKAVVDIQLCHQVSLVSFYSLGANDEYSGYLISRVPFCQQF